jgi:hypothetical protein
LYFLEGDHLVALSDQLRQAGGAFEVSEQFDRYVGCERFAR